MIVTRLCFGGKESSGVIEAELDCESLRWGIEKDVDC